MKKLIITLFTLIITVSVFSQNGREEHRDKIKALKTALITDKLDLTSAEAEKFWPIYNAFEKEQERLRRGNLGKRNDSDFESLSENEAQVMLDEMINVGKQRYELYNKFISDLKQVLPTKKIILLKRVEEEFKRKMLKEFQKRRKGKQQDRP